MRRGDTDAIIAAGGSGDVLSGNDGTDCVLALDAEQAGQASCTIAAKRTYVLQVSDFQTYLQGDKTVHVSVAVKHSPSRRGLVAGLCRFGPLPPFIPIGVTEYGDPGQACDPVPPQTGTVTWERWRLRIAHPETLTLRMWQLDFSAAGPIGNVTGSIVGDEIQVVKPNTDQLDYPDPSGNDPGHREICGTPASPGATVQAVCAFPAAGNYIVAMSLPTSPFWSNQATAAFAFH